MDFDLFHPEFLQNPYPFYQQLRSRDPVHRSALGVWLITRQPDVYNLLRSPALSSGFSRYSAHRKAIGGPISDLTALLLPLLDPPEHTRLRQLLSPMFRESVLSSARQWLPALARDMVQQLPERFELMADFAGQFPLRVIARLLGIPEADLPMIRPWAQGFFHLFAASRSARDQATLHKSVVEFQQYLEPLLNQRSQSPQEDLLSEIAALPELTRDERCAACVLLFSNGEETLGHLIGNATLALIRAQNWRTPQEWKSAIEELIRFDTPSQIVGRTARESIEIDGRVIAEGEPVYLMLGCANRDPEVFEQPESLWLQRQSNPHLSFGYGTHACLGSYLARLELRAALEALMERFPRLQLDGEPRWKGHPFRRGLVQLPLTNRAGQPQR